MCNTSVKWTWEPYDGWQTLNISSATPQIVSSGIDSTTNMTTLTSSNTLSSTNKKNEC